MSANGIPFFHADHVGSLLRPRSLLDARLRWKAGELPDGELQALEDEAIRDVVTFQESVGLRAITDGEFRRENWWIDFIRRINGIEIADDDPSGEFKTDGGEGSGYIPKIVETVGKIHHDRAIMGRDYEVIAAATSETPKVTIPSPARIHFHSGRARVNKEAYPDMDGFWDDVTAFYRAEIAALEEMGCRYIQIDDPVLTYFLDDRTRGMLVRIGEDPDTLIHIYARVFNDCIRDRGAGTHLSIHLCRGNAASAWMVSGGYMRLAEALFPVVEVDTWFLEYDDERSGTFEPLTFMPADRNVVLGLVTTKRGDMETKDELKSRIEQAAGYVEMDRLALSPQCGFASIDTGNLIAEEHQKAKLSLVVETADEVWG